MTPNLIARKDRNIFSVQCLRVVRDKGLDTKIMAAWQRRNLKGYKYFTRFCPRFKIHKNELETEEKMARTVRNMWGYGEFKVMFFSAHNPNKWGRKRRDGILKKKVMGYVPRYHLSIIEGYNPETKEDYVYEIFEEDNLMHKLEFWKGKVKRHRKAEEVKPREEDRILSDKDVVRL